MVFDTNIFKAYDLNMDDIIPQILETIVEIYGENNRKIIEDRLNRIYINTYTTLDNLRSLCNAMKSEKKDILTRKFLAEYMKKEETNEINASEELSEEESKIIRTFFGWGNQIYKFGDIMGFDDEQFEEAQKNPQLSYRVNTILQQRCSILAYYGLNITPENYDVIVQTEEGKEALEDAYRAYNISKKYLSEYDSYEKELEELKEVIQSGEDIRNRIEAKYEIEYYKKISEYLPKEIREKLDELLKNQDKYDYAHQVRNLIDRQDIYSGYDFLIGAFRSEYNDIINDDSYNSEEARKKRIKYFKLHGIDLGDDYFAYENNEEARKIWPDSEIVDKIVEIKEKMKQECDNEILLQTSNYAMCKRNLSQLGLKCEDGLSFDFMKNKVIAVVPNMIENENGDYENFNVLYIPGIDSYDHFRDMKLIHEILHVVELSVTEINGKNIIIKTGFESLGMEISEHGESTQDDEKYEHSIRKYELLSENLHQQITIAVTEELHKKGIYILDDPQKSQIRGGTSYEQLNGATQAFMLNFGKEIKEGMINSEMSYILEIVGEENLEQLNQIVTEYRKLPYYKMMREVIERMDKGGPETELTKAREELIRRANEIVETMKKHREQSKKQKGDFCLSTEEIGTVAESVSNENIQQASIQLASDRARLNISKTKDEEGEIDRDEQ